MVEFKDKEALEAWLNGQPPEVSVVIATRAVLRILPLLLGVEFSEGKLKPDAVAREIVLPVFRAISVAWATSKYPGDGIDLTARNAGEARLLGADNVTGITNTVRQVAFAADAISGRAPAVSGGGRAYSSIIAIAAAAQTAAAIDTATAAILEAVDADATRIESGMTPEMLAVEKLWTDKTPNWAKQYWDELRQTLLALDQGCRVWTRWYEARLAGRPTYRTSPKQNEQIEIARATIDDAIWDKGPAAVFAEIRRLEAELLGERWEPGEKEPDDDGELAQGPGPYRYFWREGKIEANPATDVPFDVDLAEEFLDALREKLRETREVLIGNNADPPVLAAIDRLEPLLNGSAADICIGLIYMRAVSLEAFAQAYADSSSERENNISAALADVSDSLSALTACYPVIQTLEANRLAIELQSADAVAVESSLREIEDAATTSEIAGKSVVEALATGREDVDALSEKAEQTDIHSVQATYIEERAKLVAQRVLNVKNFVGEVLKTAGSEVGGLVGDGWGAARRGIPKGIEEGSKEVAKAGVKGGAVYLAFKLLGPLVGLSALVVLFQPFAKRAEKIGEEAEKKKVENGDGEIDENGGENADGEESIEV